LVKYVYLDDELGHPRILNKIFARSAEDEILGVKIFLYNFVPYS